MNKLELSYLSAYSSAWCEMTLRLLISWLSILLTRTHSIETYLRRRSAPHSSITAFLLRSSPNFKLFCRRHLISTAQTLSLARSNERIISFASPRMIQDWPRAFCILSVYSENGISPRNSETAGSALGEHTHTGVLAQATSALTSQCSHREDHPAAILPTTAQTRNPPKKRREKDPSSVDEEEGWENE